MKNGKILLLFFSSSRKKNLLVLLSLDSASITIYVAVNRKIDDETPRSFGTSPQLSSDLILF